MTKQKVYIAIISLFLFFFAAIVHATPLYAPGQTLDPTCAPGTTDCTVQTFTAAGDLSGTATSQKVVGIQGNPVASTTPTSGQVLTWNGSVWSPAASSGTTNVVTITSASSPYTVQSGDTFIACDASGGNVVINLPAALGGGRSVTIGKSVATANACTVNPGTYDTLDSASKATLLNNYATMTFTDGQSATNQTSIPTNGYTAHYTLTAGTVTGTLTAFPATYSGTIGALRTAANGGLVQNTCTQTVGSRSLTVPCDAIFTSDSAGTSQLAGWEWESYNASTGAFVVHFNTSLSTGGVVHLWIGKASVNTLQTASANTWNSNYAAVWHFPDGSTLYPGDSTANANNGTVVGTVTSVAGEIGGGAQFVTSGNNDITVANAASLQITGHLSISAWVKITASNNPTGNLIVQKRVANNGSNVIDYAVWVSNGKILYQNYSGGAQSLYSTGSVPTGVWTHVAVTIDETASPKLVTFYINGLQDSTGTYTTGMATSTQPLQIGNYGQASGGPYDLNGSMDELRIENATDPAAWVAAEYANQSAPQTFWTIAPTAGRWYVQNAVGTVYVYVDQYATGDGVADDTAAIQAAVNSINASNCTSITLDTTGNQGVQPFGCGGVVVFGPRKYKTSQRITVASSNIVLEGAGQNSTEIIDTSTGNDDTILFNSGVGNGECDPSASANSIFGGGIADMTLYRQTPTNPGNGLNISGGCRLRVERVTSINNGSNFYFKACSDCFVFRNLAAWSPTISGNTWYGYELSSPTITTGEASIHGLYNYANAPNNAATYVGTYMHGHYVGDVDWDYPQTAGAAYGIEIISSSQTYNGNTANQNIHIMEPVLDGNTTAGIYISGLNGTGYEFVEIRGGYMAAQGNPKLLDIENSTNVHAQGIQFHGSAGTGATGVYINGSNSTNNTILNNTFENVPTSVNINGGSSNIITNNVIQNTSDIAAGTMITVAGDSNMVANNTLSGYATTGISATGNSNVIGPNIIQSAHITTAQSNSGTGNQFTPPLPMTFSLLPACSSATEGSTYAVTDSSTATYGATITGSGTDHVKAYCNGTNWVVD